MRSMPHRECAAVGLPAFGLAAGDLSEPLHALSDELGGGKYLPLAPTQGRLLITLAGVVPDIDGLGPIPKLITRHSARPLAWFSLYHHPLHNLAFGSVVTCVSLAIASRKSTTSLVVPLSFHLHLLENLVGSRGPDAYQWPIPYLAPFSPAGQLVWKGPWALNAWPNFSITLLLLEATLYPAWLTGHSPLEMVLARADRAFVRTLRSRFPQ